MILAGLWLRPNWAVFEVSLRWTHEHWAWGLSVLLGLVLIVWLNVQVFTLPEIAAIQFILYALAALLIALPLLPGMRAYFRLDDNE